METLAIGFAVLFALLLLGVPLGFGMGLVGVAGFAAIAGWDPALAMVGLTAMNVVTNYNLSVLPLFVLMGALFAHSRMADELYGAAHAFVGHRRGGLAMATILACGGFSAISGSALACAATMTRVAVPTMRRYGYAPSFAAGTVAAGSTLDILIPPSTPMVIYAVITETDLGKLMMAGILPGLLTIGCYLLVIAGAVQIWPRLGPAGRRSAWPARLRALRDVWGMVLLFVTVLGGIYLGVFTPTEAAGIGAFGALVLALARRRLAAGALVRILVQTAHATATIFVVLIGAIVFANFVTIAGGALAMQDWVASFALTPLQLILFMIAIYVVLGCILEGTAMLLLTIPIFFPIAMQAGIDPIWFGIFVVIMGGLALIHPPLGMLLFVVRALVPDIQPNAIFVGVLPYLVGDAVRMALLVAFPVIALWLPRLMG